MMYIIIYIVGLIIAAIVIPKILPYKEGMWRIEYEGAYPITEEMHKNDNLIRIIIWPILLIALIILFPIAIIGRLIDI